MTPSLRLASRRLFVQVFDTVDHRLIKAGERAGFHIEPSLLDEINQILALEPKLLRQQMDTCGQRQHLPRRSAPANRATIPLLCSTGRMIATPVYPESF
jgi:hypothetical protein